MKKIIVYIFISIVLISCGNAINRDEITGCWEVAYIDTDGVKMRGGLYQMCFEENGELITQKKDGTEKVKAEWNFEEIDSTIVLHYAGSMPDTAKIIKMEDEELHLRIKKKATYITIYLRKEK